MTSLAEAKTIIRSVLAHSNSISLMLWGPPGIGKTSIVSQVAKEEKIGLKGVIAHLYQPVDLLGLPYIDDGRCHYAPPTVFPDTAKDGDSGLFFIDELPNCVPAMQSAWGILLIERSTKHFTFPAGWKMICAGNREGDRTGANRLVSALESRLVHLDIHPTVEEFLAYGMRQNFHPMVLSFLEERQELLLQFDPHSSERAFPCPRAWERISEALRLKLSQDLFHELSQGIIGQGAALEFLSFIKLYQTIPKLKELLSGKVTLSAFAKKPDILRSLVYSVLAYTRESKEESRFENALTIALGAPDEWAILLLKRLYQIDTDKLVKAPSFGQVAARYGKYLAS